MNKYTNIALGLLLSAAPLAGSAAPTVHAEMDSTIMTMGSVATLTVTVAPAEGTECLGFPVIAPDGPGYVQFGPVQVVDARTDTLDDGRLQYIYKVQGFDPGLYTLPRFAAVASGSRDTAFSEIMPLKILPVEVDTLAMELKPFAGTADIPLKWHDYIPMWVLWMLLGLAVGAVVVAGVMSLTRLKKKKAEERARPIPPYEQALRDLSALRLLRLADTGREKEFYTRLTDILRRYLDGRFGINAMEMTSGQIVHAMRSNPQTRLRSEEVREVLRVADFVKFAKERPLANDNERALARAFQFVEDTKPVPPPPAPKGKAALATKKNQAKNQNRK